MKNERVSVVDSIKGYLDGKTVKDVIERDLGLNSENGKYKCWLHNDIKNPNMSFHMEGKMFNCFRCGGKYDIFDHYMSHYGLGFYDACLKIIDDLRLPIELGEKKKPKEKPKKWEAVTGKPLDYLHKRGFSNQTIKAMPISCKGNYIYFEYHNEHGVHEANKKREARKFSKDEKKQFSWDTGTTTLYNMQNVVPTTPLIITEGEFDAIAVYEAGYKNVVSVSAGATSTKWIDDNYEWLSQFIEVWLWYDNDKAGLEGVNKIAPRLGNCTRVINAGSYKDANEVLLLAGRESVLKCIETARVLEVDKVVTAKDIEAFNVHEAEKIRTGIKLLDHYMYGFVMGSVDIITGYNGSGKSTLINQMCIAEPISQGHKVFVYSGELTHANLKYWLYSTLANEKDLMQKTTADGIKYCKLTQFGEDKITDWINDKLYIYDNDNVTQQELIETMEKLARRKGVDVFVIDNLMMVELAEHKNELTAQKQFVKALKQFARRFNAVVHLVAHPRKPSENGQKLNKFDVAGSGDITNLSDYVIGVHRVSEAEKQAYAEDVNKKGEVFSGKNPKDATIMLFKDRPTGTGDREANLYFNKDRKRFYLSDSELNFDYGYDKEPIQEDLRDMPF